MNAQNVKRVIYIIMFIFLLSTARAMAIELSLQDLIPGTKYYFDDFNPELRPWTPGELRNIEEVFKNYQYVEIVLDADGRTMTVKQYVQGAPKEEARYRLSPEGILQKEP